RPCTVRERNSVCSPPKWMIAIVRTARVGTGQGGISGVRRCVAATEPSSHSTRHEGRSRDPPTSRLSQEPGLPVPHATLSSSKENGGKWRRIMVWLHITLAAIL